MAQRFPGTVGALRAYHLGYERAARNTEISSRDARGAGNRERDCRGRKGMGGPGMEGCRYENRNVQDSAGVREAVWGGERSDGGMPLGSKGNLLSPVCSR